MTTKRLVQNFTRRGFLRGAAGVSFALPLLDALPRNVLAAPEPGGGCAVFVVHTFGVQQAGYGQDAEGFWPRAPGPLSPELFAANADRALSELAAHADRLLFVRGIKFPFAPNGDLHVCGANQVLTAANMNDGKAQSESVDNYIARGFETEPLTLYAGSKMGTIADCLFFSGPGQLRAGENNPFAAYARMMGSTAAANEEFAQRIQQRRESVNDLVREELQGLLAHPALSAEDRRRLELHLSVVRDVEVNLTGELSTEQVAELEAVQGTYGTSEARLRVERLHMDLAVLALASGYARAVGMQLGNGHDDMRHALNGATLERAHMISHRSDHDFQVNDSTPEGIRQHHEIDRINARQFKYLLDQMARTETPNGTLLDLGYAVWTNFIATGNHNYYNVPYVIGGRAGGYLRTGQFLNVSGNLGEGEQGTIPNNRLLNVLINAAGLRKSDGSPVDDFGDAGLPRELIGEMITG